ncbi:N-terminal Xaa-Pro-Lys N-methyltransferase 1-B [Nematostella vectensis]|uniref:N-terminal Xaa-Pro-Lys N-methyltransferase 1-B n=1 Tax=Nematostella vectensis TaxID=45351 RepID=UPI0020777B6F|nr:N-terminal Xaa-Pro-Lys N-methyltransferase 1-B [Nematostella vectensis]
MKYLPKRNGSCRCLQIPSAHAYCWRQNQDGGMHSLLIIVPGSTGYLYIAWKNPPETAVVLGKMESTDQQVVGVAAMDNKDQWYGGAQKYWKEIPATVDGMLGGFSAISPADVWGSTKFLKELLNPSQKKRELKTSQLRPQAHTALDCGAGIGRVTKHVLLPLFETVDMVEQNPDYLEKAKEYLGEKSCRIGHFYPVGLQEFDPEAGRYDVIWCQWVMLYLTDEDFVSFLNRCKKGLKEGGVVCVKENVSKKDYEFDAEDSSVTRSHRQYTQLFKQANLNLIKQETQKNMPSDIYKVNMYALAPSPLRDKET